MERAGRLIGKLKMCASPEDLARAAWPVAVGARIASHAAAVALDGSRLIVEVEDAVWRRHLTTLSGQIVKRFDEVLGSRLVSGLEFRLMVPRRMPAREERSARPHDEAETIADQGLRRLYKVARRKAAG